MPVGLHIAILAAPNDKQIVFSVGEDVYSVIEDDSGNQYPYRVYKHDRGYLPVNNINTWVHETTLGRYNLDTLLDLGDAFRRGQASAYTYDVLQQCAEEVVDEVLKQVWVNGLASRFAAKYDIECKTRTQLKDYIWELTKIGSVGRDVIRRVIRVCQTNNYDDLLELINRTKSTIQIVDGANSDPDIHYQDNFLRGAIKKFVEGKYKSK